MWLHERTLRLPSLTLIGLPFYYTDVDTQTKDLDPFRPYRVTLVTGSYGHMFLTIHDFVVILHCVISVDVKGLKDLPFGMHSPSPYLPILTTGTIFCTLFCLFLGSFVINNHSYISLIMRSYTTTSDWFMSVKPVDKPS